MKILICEDDAGIQEMMAVLLEDMGHTTLNCDNQKEVITLLEQEQIDLIIMDYWLSDGKADSIIKRAKNSHPNVPIIIVSAISNLEEIMQTLAVDDYLKKPFDIFDFKAKVTNLLNGADHSSD